MWRIIFVIMLAISAAFIYYAGNSIAQASSGSEGIRIIISTTGKVEYNAQKLENPHRLTIDFLTKNVFSDMAGRIVLNKGVISAIEGELYDSSDSGLRPLKRLTFYLTADVPYNITQESLNILIDIQGVSGMSKKDALELVDGRSPAYALEKRSAIEYALSKKGKGLIEANRVKITWQDILSLSILSVCVFWLISLRRDWAKFKDEWLRKNIAVYKGDERRRWWRHNLSPLAKDVVSLELAAAAGSDKKIKVPASDIGYGGASFKLGILDNIPKLDRSSKVNILLSDGTSIETEGTLIWKRNKKSIIYNSFGIVFTKHLHSEWDKIDRLVISEYAKL